MARSTPPLPLHSAASVSVVSLRSSCSHPLATGRSLRPRTNNQVDVEQRASLIPLPHLSLLLLLLLISRISVSACVCKSPQRERARYVHAIGCICMTILFHSWHTWTGYPFSLLILAQDARRIATSPLEAVLFRELLSRYFLAQTRRTFGSCLFTTLDFWYCCGKTLSEPNWLSGKLTEKGVGLHWRD